MQFFYYITLGTGMGIKRGTMAVDIANGKIEGYLTLMRHENYFTGDISRDGSITFKGEIQSLLSSVGYRAVGKLSAESVTARITTDKSVLYLNGMK